MSEHVTTCARELRQYAEHFVQHDWNYTRDVGNLLPLRHSGTLLPSIKQALWWLTMGHPEWARELGTVNRWRMFRAALRGRHSRPDGVLDSGNIIVQWEETGEYLQYVQPSIGTKLADWMEDEPDNPHAQGIAAEMKRIRDAYTARIAAAEATR